MERNTAGEAIKFSLDSLISGINRAVAAGSKSISINGGYKSVKVGGGARTLDVSPDGKYLFVACNSGNAVYMVDANEMKVVDHIRCDSYPVGLAVSLDGRRMIVTSQGRQGNGGNAVNIFDIRRPDLPEVEPCPEPTDTLSVSPAGAAATGGDPGDNSAMPPTVPNLGLIISIALVLVLGGFLGVRGYKRRGKQ